MTQRSDFLVWGNNQLNLLSKSASQCLSTPVPLSLPYAISSICASEKHISFLTTEGELYSYGANLDGRLGVSTRTVDKASFTEPVKIDVGSKIIRAESGFSHMCILSEKLQLFAWGLGDYGALGTGEFKSRSVPTLVDIPVDKVAKLRQISCGAMHTAFLFEDGSVYTCGSNEYGELGITKPEKVSTPIEISFYQPVHQVSCGVFYTLLLTRDGRVYGMGNNKYGQLGTGHKVNECHPTLIRQLNDIVKVTAGYHSGAIDKFGNLYIWGSGSFGELLKPKKFVLSVPIKDIAIRGFFGVAIGHTSKNQNRIYSWGNNTFGQLGMGNYQASKQPQQIETLRGLEVNKIALGVNFALVLLHSPTIQSRLMEDEYEQNELSYKRKLKQNRKNLHSKVSDRKSIIGFDERYLSSNAQSTLQRNIEGRSIQKGPFQNILTQRESQFEAQNSTYLGSKSLRKQRQDQDKRSNKSPIGIEYRNNYNLVSVTNPFQNVRRQERLPETKQRRGPLEGQKDYEKLFLQLSQDYEALVKKYVHLEKQIELNKSQQRHEFDRKQERDSYLADENTALKGQISKLNYQNAILGDEVVSLKRKNDDLVRLNERILQDQARQSVVTLSPAPFRSESMSSQIEEEYKKLLIQKQQIISQLKLANCKYEQEQQTINDKLNDENTALKNQLSNELKNNRKIINEHQSLIDELEAEIKKFQHRSLVLKQQNQVLKSELINEKTKAKQLEQNQLKMSEVNESERVFREKYQINLRESEIRGEAFSSRIAQLQVQLAYEKQFNRKYQQTILQIKQNNQKLHKELNLQIDYNTQKVNKIQSVKLENEKLKKYKKDLDQKNIQFQEFQDNFENFKRKTREIIEQKQIETKSNTQSFQKKIKEQQLTIERLSLEIEDLVKQGSVQEKQISKNKENISLLKNQITVKDDEIQHSNQSKSNMQKKLNIVSNQLKKQIDERENLMKQSGQVKRELAKLKFSHSQLENKLNFEVEQKQKLSKVISQRDKQVQDAKSEMISLNERCENLRKENIMHKQQVETLSYQLQAQSKINEQLGKANRQFAESQQQFADKVADLQAKIYELQDQNKSYTPRYQALLIRNRQLDQRNRELGQMINKAIQIQAESYKNNILKEVQINTDNIISQFKEEQEFQFRGRRNKNKSKEFQKELAHQSMDSKIQILNPVKEQPYTKMMKERITQHKRKVSESAHKLASLLELEGKGKSSKGFQSGRHQTQDYERINSQMESFNNQKEQFMSKIQSFAQKLKII